MAWDGAAANRDSRAYSRRDGISQKRLRSDSPAGIKCTAICTKFVIPFGNVFLQLGWKGSPGSPVFQAGGVWTQNPPPN
jgi:hypothetical protein